MARPRLCRKVSAKPRATYFKPRGIPLSDLAEVYLPLEGLEALRLADLQSLTTSEAAARMGISRHTFGRILGEARRQVANALVNALALRIEEGETPFPERGEGVAEAQSSRRISMERIAVTAEAPGLDSPVDPRFGRAAGFVVVDTQTMECSWVDNGASQAMSHGAGIQAAERVADAGAGVLLTGFVGPKAFQALKAAGVKVGQGLDGGSVRDAVESFKAGNVAFADAPNK
ncbi:hypothetical protein JCM15519_06700 [Fundidesulfovibrio butyratiphilus]